MTAEQAMVVGFVAVLIVQGIKIVWVGLLKRPKPSQGVTRAIAVAVAAGLAYLWRPAGAPLPVPALDPFGFAQALLAQAGAIFVFAHVIYDTLIDKILTRLDQLTLARWLRRPVLAP